MKSLIKIQYKTTQKGIFFDQNSFCVLMQCTDKQITCFHSIKVVITSSFQMNIVNHCYQHMTYLWVKVLLYTIFNLIFIRYNFKFLRKKSVREDKSDPV